MYPPTAYLKRIRVPSPASEKSQVMLPCTPMRPSGPSPPDSRRDVPGMTDETVRCTTPASSPSDSQKQPCTAGSMDMRAASPDIV